jgi:hypothetical protein
VEPSDISSNWREHHTALTGVLSPLPFCSRTHSP